MGAGCYYTNKYYDKDNHEQYVKAVWLEVDPEDNSDYEFGLYTLFNDLKSLLNVIYSDDNEILTSLYKIHFEPTYYGDGIIIKQTCLLNDADYLEPNEIKLRNLANYNFEKNYYSMINKLCKLGYKFRIATSPYTSGEYQYGKNNSKI
jgi:hypothetical protein